MDLAYITRLFRNQGFSLVDTVTNDDSLNRDTLTWIRWYLKVIDKEDYDDRNTLGILMVLVVLYFIFDFIVIKVPKE